jgi:hypothetical protein
MRGFHDLLRQKPTSLFILFEWISMASLTLIPHSRIFSTLKMEAILSSETSVNTKSTQRHIPEDFILHFYLRS